MTGLVWHIDSQRHSFDAIRHILAVLSPTPKITRSLMKHRERRKLEDNPNETQSRRELVTRKLIHHSSTRQTKRATRKAAPRKNARPRQGRRKLLRLLCGRPYQTTSPITLIFSQPNKLRPPSVTIQRPCSELDLCNQLRFWLRTVSHLLLGCEIHCVRFYSGK